MHEKRSKISKNFQYLPLSDSFFALFYIRKKSDVPRFCFFLVHHPCFSAQIPVSRHRCTRNQLIWGTSLFMKVSEGTFIEYILFEIFQRSEQRDIVEAAGDADIVVSVKVFFTDHIHLTASGVESHFEQ